MKDITDVEYNDDGQIIDCLSGSAIKDTPEERVRQRFIKILQSDYGYPKDCILREIPVQSARLYSPTKAMVLQSEQILLCIKTKKLL